MSDIGNSYISPNIGYGIRVGEEISEDYLNGCDQGAQGGHKARNAGLVCLKVAHFVRGAAGIHRGADDQCDQVYHRLHGSGS
jgi:hypothetical protein